MKPSLIFIAPTWNPELEELIHVTKESFALKVLTQKQSFDFDDPFVEILQCFESYSPVELAKLLPWMLHLNSPQFHVLLPEKANARQLAGVGALASMARAIPNSYITHSPWPTGSWSFPIWLKAFQNLFDGPMTSIGRRSLSLPKIQGYRDANRSIKSVDIFRHLWVFPSKKGMEIEWRSLIQALLNRYENLLEFWNWDHLAIRQQNKIRQQFALVWEQFRTRQPRTQFEDWDGVQFLVLIGGHDLLFSESDLLDLALHHGTNIIMDAPTRRKLQGPWKDGDTFWLWHPSQKDNEHRPWNSPYVLLPFLSKSELKVFRDQMSNQVLRSFIKLDFQRQEY